jgi:heme oxygenase
MNSEGGTVLGALRRACADRHQALEALLQLEHTRERGRYERVLAGFGAFLPRWEVLVRPRLPASLQAWFDERSRWPLLERDLAALGLRPAEVPDPVAALALPDRAALFGSLYVLEGSALGGQVIARRAQQLWSLGPDNGAAYFNGWGARTGARWAEFRALLHREADAPAAAQHSACLGAVATFEALQACFARVLADG